MPLYQTEGPSQRIMTLAEAKSHLRVDHNDDDGLINGLILAIEQSVDGRDGWLGRALVEQSWQLRLQDFCGSRIRIPLPPLIAVDSVEYYDADNTLQTLATTVYEVVGVAGHNPGCVALLDGQSWPDVAVRAEAVLINFRAGYLQTATSPTPAGIPQPIIQGLLLTLGTLYARREDVVVGTSVALLPGPAAMLLSPYQVAYFP